MASSVDCLDLTSTPIGLGEVGKFEIDLLDSPFDCLGLCPFFLPSTLAGNGEVAKLEVDLAARSPRSSRTARNPPIPRPVVMLLLLNATGL